MSDSCGCDCQSMYTRFNFTIITRKEIKLPTRSKPEFCKYDSDPFYPVMWWIRIWTSWSVYSRNIFHHFRFSWAGRKVALDGSLTTTVQNENLLLGRWSALFRWFPLVVECSKVHCSIAISFFIASFGAIGHAVEVGKRKREIIHQYNTAIFSHEFSSVPNHSTTSSLVISSS